MNDIGLVYNPLAVTPANTSVPSHLPVTQQKIVLVTLRSILESTHFSRSPRSSALLEFVVRNALQGNAGSSKERTVGIEVFGRQADYDTNSDPIVRTAAVEVRRRIVQYFSEHPESPVRIQLPAGSYRATIYFSPEPAYPSPAQEGINRNDRRGVEAPLDRLRDLGLTQSSDPQSPAVDKLRSRRMRYSLLGCSVTVLGVLLGIGVWRHQRAASVREFWGPVFQGGAQPLLLVERTAEPAAREPTEGRMIASAHGLAAFQGLTMDDASTAARVCDIFGEYGRACTVESPLTASEDDLRDRPLVVVGGVENPRTQELLASLPLSPQPGAGGTTFAERQQAGGMPMWAFKRNVPARVGDEYALIARFRRGGTGSMIVVLAGLGAHGVSQASQLAFQPENLRELLAQAPRGWKGENFEAVVEVSVERGGFHSSDVLASNFW